MMKVARISLVWVSARCFLQWFDDWLGNRKDIRPVKSVHHLSSKVPFWNNWRKWMKTAIWNVLPKTVLDS